MLCVKRELEIRRPLHMRCQTGAALLLTPKGMEKKVTQHDEDESHIYIPTLCKKKKYSYKRVPS